MDEGSLKPAQTKFEALEPLSEQEKCYLTAERECRVHSSQPHFPATLMVSLAVTDIQRCLRATRWDVQKAIARSEEILVWRREYGTNQLRYADVEEEGRTAKQFLQGYDIDARPIHYMFPDRQNVRSRPTRPRLVSWCCPPMAPVADRFSRGLQRQTKVSPRQIQFVVFLLERTIDLMPQGVENLCLCIDFNASNGGGQPTTVGQARTVLYSESKLLCGSRLFKTDARRTSRSLADLLL